MKASRLIRNLLLAGTVSLTLASCGGGGGGGGGSSSGNDSTVNTPNTQNGYAPYNLSGCTMTYTHDGKPYTFTFDGSGKVSGVWENGSFTTNYDGTYTYSRSADGNGASLTMYTTSGTSALGMTYSQTFDMELSFASTTQATAQVSYTNKESYNGNDIPADEEDEYTTSVTFSGVQNNGSSDGESNDDTSSDGSAQLAPDSLPVGTVVNLQSSSGTKTSYTLTTADTCTSESGSTLKWEYSNTGDTTADLVTYNALNIPLTYKLVFTSADGGTYTYVNAGGEASVTGTFNLSDKSDAPSQGDSDDSSEESENEIGAAPDSLKNYSVRIYNKRGFYGTFYFSKNEVYTINTYTTLDNVTYRSKLYGGINYYIPAEDRKSAKLKFYISGGYVGPSYTSGETVDAILIFDDYGNITEIWGTWKNVRGEEEIDYTKSDGSKI